MGEQIDFTNKLNDLHKSIKTSFKTTISRKDALEYKRYLDELYYGKDTVNSEVTKAVKAKLKNVHQQYANNIAEVTDKLRVNFSSFYNIDEFFGEKVSKTAFQSKLSQLRAQALATAKEENARYNKNLQDFEVKTVKMKQEILKTFFDNLSCEQKNNLNKYYTRLYKLYQEIDRKLFENGTSVTEKTRFLQKFGNDEITLKGLKELFYFADALTKTERIEAINGDALEYFLAGSIQGYYETETKDVSQIVTDGIADALVQGGDAKVWESELIKNSTDDDDIVIDLNNIEVKFSKKGFNPFTSRQGKTDVTIEINSEIAESKKINPNIFKISAKNWGRANGDFGSTEYIYGILRTLQSFDSAVFKNFLDVIANYTQPDKENREITNLSAIHNIAKYSIAADLLVGYSQGVDSSANMIVLNIQNQQQFIVCPLEIIFGQIRQNIDSFKVKGYPSDDDFKNIDRIESIDINGQHVFDYTQLLQALKFNDKVSIPYSSISSYIPELLKTKTKSNNLT